MTPLKSVRLINRMLFLDNDPALNHLLPLNNAWTVNELASEIIRACIEYDRSITLGAAFYLAERLIHEKIKVRPELGWE